MYNSKSLRRLPPVSRKLARLVNECQVCFRKFKTPASLYRHLFLFHSIHPDIADDWAYGYRDDNSTQRTVKEQERRTLTLQEAVDHANMK